MDTIMTIDNFTLFYIFKVWQNRRAHSNIFNYFPLFTLIVIQFLSFVWIKLEEVGQGNIFSISCF